MRLIPSVIYSSIAYFMIGLQASIDRFLVFLFTLFLSTVFGSAMCFFVASSIPIFGKTKNIDRSIDLHCFRCLVVSLIIVIFIFVVMMVFSGFLIDLESIFPSLQWIRWFSAFRYATNLLTINEFRQLNFCETMNQTHNCSYPGEEVLRTRQIPFQTEWEVWNNIVALSAMIFLLFFFTYLQLVRMKKVK
jgi:ATP-binding cassette, subfamily G (WHITE), member 2